MNALGSMLGVLFISATSQAAVTRIPLRVPEWTGADREEVVTSGVPLAKGTLRNVGACRLLDDQGREVPFVGTALARWPDGSIKWLLLDFPVRVAARQTAHFTLECGVRASAKLQGPAVTTAEAKDAITVTTGPLRFRIHRSRYTFLDAVILDRNGDGRFSDSEHLIVPGRGDSRLEIETTPPGPPQEENWLRDAAGGPRRSFVATVTRAEVEFHNPLRAVVLVRGEYRDPSGRSIGPFWTRYTAWAGSTTLGLEHFWAFDADVEKAFLRTVSLALQLAGRAPLKTTFGVENDESIAPAATLCEVALLEVMPDRFYHLVPLSVDRRVRYQVVGREGTGRGPAGRGGPEKILKEGVEATGWVSLQSEQGTATLALRDFPRLHPKEIRVEPARRTLRYYLWPERGGKVLDLRRRYRGERVEDHYDTGEYAPAGRGFGKTHQMLLDFRKGAADPAAAQALARRAEEPLRAFCPPEHYASCDVWNQFHPVDPQRFPQTESLIRLSLEWALRLPRLFHWDGLVDWGDTLFQGYEVAPHNQVKEVPKTSWVVRGYDGWFNNDCNVSHDFLMHFLRSGDGRLWRYTERMIQHVMDVDTIHAAEDPTEVGGGRRHDQQHWGATYTGYGTAAVEAGELYYLTGSLWAKEMLLKYADWYMVGGGSEWETRLPCLVLAWEATGDRRYMDFIQRPAMRQDLYGLKLGDYGSLDRPHWRTCGVELGVDFLYRATGDPQWLEHLTTAARRCIEQDPGNGYGLALLAKAYLATGDREILDWLRRALVVADPYGRGAQLAFFRSHQIPDDLTDLSWDELHELAKQAGVADVRVPIYKYRYYPYVMAALVKAGLEEKQAELVDFALDRRGMGQFHLRGPDVPEPIDGHYEPISIASVANVNPLADPFGQYDGWTRHPLNPGEIGFDFGEWGECEPGYLPVRPATRYPYRAPLPSNVEHDGTNLIGLPWGTLWYANNVPYLLPNPATAPGGQTLLLLGKGEKVAIPIGKTARKLYVLGHVCRAQSPWKKVGARYHLNYADGTERSMELTNLEDYEGVFQWGFAQRALFTRNWKVQGGWDGGAPILHTYALPVEPKPLKELIIEDAGEGIGFMILALTAEVDGAKPESPLLDFGFGPNDPGAATNGWREGAPWGWLNISGELTQSSGVLSDGSATFRSTLPDGLYEIELETAGVGWGAPFNVRVNGRLAVRGYVASSGCVPGVASRPERIRFPVRVQGGRLDLTLEADRTVGNWRHPVRLRGGSWHLTRLRIYPGKEEPAEPPSEVAYGWEEDDLTAVALPSEVTQVKDARLQSGMRSKSARGTFRADLPAGEYEAELLFAVRGDGTREGPVRMNVVVQGQPVHREFDGGSYRQPVVIQLPVRVEPGESFTLTLERSTPESEWGINALILRKPGFRRPVLDCGSRASADRFWIAEAQLPQPKAAQKGRR